MNFWRGWQGKNRVESLFQLFFGIYLFIIPYEHFPAIRNIALFTSLLFFFWLGFQGKLHFPSNLSKWERVGIFTLMFGILVSSLVGIALQQVEVESSLKAIWMNLLEDIYILFAILLYFNTRDKVLQLLKIVTLSYGALILFSLYDVVSNYLSHGWTQIDDRSNRENHFFWWAGFARISALYLPVMVGLGVYFWESLKKWEKVGGILIAVGGFILLVLYRSSAPLVFTTLAVVGVFWFKFRPPKWVGVVVIGVVIGGAYLFDTYLNPYPKIFNWRQYDILHNQQSFNGRGGMWKGYFQMLDTPEKLAFGYGYGWKKLGEIGKNYRPLFKKEGNQRAFNFFDGYGKSNPHNTYIEVLMDSGVIGELLFLILVGVGLYWGWRGGELGRVVIVPFFISYILNSFINGFWQENGGKFLFFMVGVGVIAYLTEKKKGEIKV